MKCCQPLPAWADVFITNLLPQRLKRYRLTYQDLCTPTTPGWCIWHSVPMGIRVPTKTGLVLTKTAFWARSGMMSSFGRPGEVPVQPPPGTGDHMTAPLLLAGILTAILSRERTGRGQEVGVSLFNSGLWALGSDLQDSLVARRQPKRHPRSQGTEPTPKLLPHLGWKMVDNTDGSYGRQFGEMLCRARQAGPFVPSKIPFIGKLAGIPLELW